MPKYFPDERPLPFTKVLWSIDEITTESIEAVFSEHDSASFCIRLPGLEPNCAGYIVNVKGRPQGFEIIDITGKKLVTLHSAEEIKSFLQHAAGINIDDSIRERLLRVRDSSA